MLNAVTDSLASPDAPYPSQRPLEPAQLHRFKKFGDSVNRLGANFAVLDAQGRLALVCDGGPFQSDHQKLAECGRMALEKHGSQCSHRSQDSVRLFDKPKTFVTAVLNLHSAGTAVAIIDLPEASATSEPADQYYVDYFQQMLGILADASDNDHRARDEIEELSAELAQTYEELVLLHKLSTNMKVTESDANYLQMACDSLTDIVTVEGIAVFLEKTVEDEKRLLLCAGSGLIDVDEHTAAIMQTRLASEIDSGKEALLDSEVDSPFKYEWPSNINSIIAVPLYGTDRIASPAPAEKRANENFMIGLMVAINRLDKPDFDSTDIKLFNSVANGCAVFVENGRLFADLKDLFIGSLKALTNSIDAKDQYTRGHSERVAFISRWIGERLAEQTPLDQEQIHKFYLAGLLHDIGKMGIAEAVLCKKGKLTQQEISHIRSHPSIGAGILGEIKQMRDIVPGVLCHHERMDGKGYPNGLVADQIPLIGKIVGLADGFDAMTSKRVYRDAMTVEQALTEIERTLGTQFDQHIGRVFINSNVHQLWDIIQDGFAEVYGNKDFLEYGAVAVGTLIR
jgi:HD-GYP domain-containing protein (c-di-GMP phosphodiesterase class II)